MIQGNVFLIVGIRSMVVLSDYWCCACYWIPQQI